MRKNGTGMNFDERLGLVMENLGPFGIYREGAKGLARMDEVIGLLKSEGEIPHNYGERPECPASGINMSSRARYPYRKAMAEYLEPWLGPRLSLESLGWPSLEALANYCESRAGKVKP